MTTPASPAPWSASAPSGWSQGLTLAVEPAFDVAQTLYIDLPVDVACDELDAVMGSAYSLSLFTDYRRDVIDQVWWKGRLDTDGDPPSALFGARPATESLHPVPGVSAESCTEQLGVPGPWADRLTHFRLGFEPSSGDELQSEFFVGRADGPAAIRAVLALRDRLATVLKVSEIRTVAADDLWLSTAYGRDTVALHFTWVNDVAAVMAFLPYLEAALEPFDARPHWGKLTALPGEVVRRRSGRWDDFASLRQALDPNGTFLNPYVSARGQHIGLRNVPFGSSTCRRGEVVPARPAAPNDFARQRGQLAERFEPRLRGTADAATSLTQVKCNATVRRRHRPCSAECSGRRFRISLTLSTVTTGPATRAPPGSPPDRRRARRRTPTATRRRCCS